MLIFILGERRELIEAQVDDAKTLRSKYAEEKSQNKKSDKKYQKKKKIRKIRSCNSTKKNVRFLPKYYILIFSLTTSVRFPHFFF